MVEYQFHGRLGVGIKLLVHEVHGITPTDTLKKSILAVLMLPQGIE
jgi:hypothetical protein